MRPNGSTSFTPVFHFPAAIEHLRRLASHAPADLGRLQVVRSAANRVGDPRGQELQIRRVRVALKHAPRGGRAVRVRGRDRHPVERNAGVAVRQVLGLVEHRAWNHAAIADHDRERGLAVVEHQRSRVQLVVHVRGGAIAHAAVDRNAQVAA